MNPNAAVLVLAHKLESINEYIRNRIDFVDDLTKNEFKFIQDILNRYEKVPKDWSLENLKLFESGGENND